MLWGPILWPPQHLPRVGPTKGKVNPYGGAPGGITPSDSGKDVSS